MFTTVTLSELSPLPSSSNLIQSLGLYPSSRAHSAPPHKRFASFSPCYCIHPRKNQRRKSLHKTDSSLNLRWLISPKETLDGDDGDKAENSETGAENKRAVQGAVLAGVLVIGAIGGLGAVGYAYKEPINVFLTNFSDFIDGYGAAGYALFVAVYAGLEVLAIPAIPLTMSAGLLFGSITGTIIVSIGGTIAASIAFLIARYFARERILKLVEGNKKFLAIDKAIGKNSFKVVTLLRLSPLLPFSLGNYLYGLTSVEFVPYVLGSWLGMLPGSWAYVTAGALGRAVIQEGSGFRLPEGNGELLTIGLGFLATGLAAFYVTKIAKDAIKDIE